MSHRFLPYLESIWDFLTKVLLALLLYLSPIKIFIHLISALIIIDFIMGISKSLMLREAITPKKMKKTVYKLILYSVAIITAYLVQQIAGDEGIGWVRIAALFIGVTEAKSIYDHISKMIGGDIFSRLWEILISKIDIPLNKKEITKENEQPD